MGEYWYFGGEKSGTKRQVSHEYLDSSFCSKCRQSESLTVDSPRWTSFYYVKVSKIDGCQLVRQADMEFDFYIGSCQSFDQPAPKILLCFDLNHPSECHT